MTSSTDCAKPLPLQVPEAAFFWAAAARGELHLQRCLDCQKAYFPPRPFCPYCGSRNIEIFRASGRGTLHSYVISHTPTPGFDTPFAIAIVELEEGPRMMSNILDCAQTPEALVLDMPLEVTFESRRGVAVPQFRPTGGKP